MNPNMPVSPSRIRPCDLCGVVIHGPGPVTLEERVADHMLKEHGDLKLMPHLRAGLVIRPGDRVLLTTIEPFHRDLERMQDELKSLYPSVEFVIVAGVTDIAVQREADAPIDYTTTAKDRGGSIL